MKLTRLLAPCVLLAGCAGASPEPVVGAEPSDVQVVSVAPPPEVKPAVVESIETRPAKTATDDDETRAVQGSLAGAETGEAFGVGGLGGGIGLGGIGPIGHGAGTGAGQGFGNGHGRLGGAHASPPRITMGARNVKGSLPPEVIQRIVRQHFGRFRLCYEIALRKDPKLAGKVTVHFIIDKTGAVTSVGNGGSDLKDPLAISCVLRVFNSLAFPSPTSGAVAVDYPLLFAPGDPPASAAPAAKATP